MPSRNIIDAGRRKDGVGSARPTRDRIPNQIDLEIVVDLDIGARGIALGVVYCPLPRRDPRGHIPQQLGRRLFLAVRGEVIVHLPIAEKKDFAGSAVGLPQVARQIIELTVLGAERRRVEQPRSSGRWIDPHQQIGEGHVDYGFDDRVAASDLCQCLIAVRSRFELELYRVGAERGDRSGGLDNRRSRGEMIRWAKSLRAENVIEVLDGSCCLRFCADGSGESKTPGNQPGNGSA